MKTGILVLMVSLISFSVKGQIKTIRELKGTWQIGGEAEASLQVIDSSTILLTYMGETKKITDYTIDFSKSPAWFDFTTTDSTSVLKIKSLIQVMGNDILKWQLFIDEDRPAHFSATRGELFYLKKHNAVPAVVSN